MLSQFPARDVEEPVTKEFLRAELAELETRLTNRMVTIVGLGVLVLTVVIALFA